MESVAVSRVELRAFSRLANEGDVTREADQMGAVVVLGQIRGFLVALTTNGHTGAMQVFPGVAWPLGEKWVSVHLKDAKGLVGAGKSVEDNALKIEAEGDRGVAWYDSDRAKYPVRVIEKPSWVDALVGFMELPADAEAAKCIGLDPGYLASMEAWNSAAKVRVVAWRLWFDGDMKAVHARPNDRDDITYIVMPHQVGGLGYSDPIAVESEAVAV